ncbi:MAG: tRNA pseudouridine(55) synthase TruB [Lachnospiraceae bacterium]|nr:tRNA pseudouridine(55) synthase TruB [Lachnospiraceae bacterium]
MYHGIVNVYKEAGYTSHDVVARLRGIFKQKKIGHTGTLDPDAVGVLPVCLGNGTRLCDMLTDRHKEYIARMRLGLVTDTQDISGKTLEEREVLSEPFRVRETIMSFQGDSMQIPPMYSALKVDGRKLYELARAGKEVERTPRPVTIYSIEVLKEEHPEYVFRAECSKGTYIRTLCHDIGRKLGDGAAMVSLERTRVGEFKAAEAYRINELEELAGKGELSSVVVPVEKMFKNLPALVVKERAFKLLQNGNQLKKEDFTDLCKKTAEAAEKRQDTTDDRTANAGEVENQYRVYSPLGVFCGIYQYVDERRVFAPVKMFLGE